MVIIHNMKNCKAISLYYAIAALGIFMALAACTKQPANGSPTATAQVSPTPTATPAPLGSVENPVVMGFVESSTGSSNYPPEQVELAQAITVNTGFTVSSRVYDNWEDLLEAMQDGEVHLAWMQPLTYLYASEEGIAEIGLLSNHFGLYYYGVQYLANIESGFTVYYDAVGQQNTADAATALAQFGGRRPCWIEPKSISGYVVPASLLAANEVLTLDGAYVQTHTAAVRALYIKGICDFAATFAISGDPRTASGVLDDLPDALNRVVIIWRTDASIPSLGLAYSQSLPEEFRQAINLTLTDLVKTDTGKAILAGANDGYDIQDLRVVDDSIYDTLRENVSALSYDLENALGR